MHRIIYYIDFFFAFTACVYMISFAINKLVGLYGNGLKVTS